MCPADPILAVSECQRVGVATEKGLVAMFVSSLGPELDDQRCLGFLAGVSSECNYVGCLDEVPGR